MVFDFHGYSSRIWQTIIIHPIWIAEFDVWRGFFSGPLGNEWISGKFGDVWSFWTLKQIRQLFFLYHCFLLNPYWNTDWMAITCPLSPQVFYFNCGLFKNIWVYVDPQKDYSKTLPKRIFFWNALCIWGEIRCIHPRWLYKSLERWDGGFQPPTLYSQQLPFCHHQKHPPHKNSSVVEPTRFKHIRSSPHVRMTRMTFFFNGNHQLENLDNKNILKKQVFKPKKIHVFCIDPGK